jgi:DNA-binding beta-propeller fold protein YncE
MLKRAMWIAPALLLAARPAVAGPNDILIGLDQKVSSGPQGLVNGAPGKDEVLVMDVTVPTKPVIRARLPLMNSLLGPPTNLQITPDGKTALIANSVLNTPDADGFKVSPDDRLFVVDLTTTPPKLTDTVNVGKQPSGMAISRKGDLALIANRAGKSVSVLSIANGKVSVVGEVSVDQEASAVAITPDGKRAFVALNTVNRIGVLSIHGQTVTYLKPLDIPVAFNPYNIDITPNGKFAIVSTTGAGRYNSDALAVIEVDPPAPTVVVVTTKTSITGPAGTATDTVTEKIASPSETFTDKGVTISEPMSVPRVVQLMAPGTGPEAFAISPDGKWVAAALPRGAGMATTAIDWFKTKEGELVLMALDQNTGELTIKSRAPLGVLPEGIAFSPSSEFVYVGEFVDADLRVFRTYGGLLKQVGQPIKPGGQPASMRGLAH